MEQSILKSIKLSVGVDPANTAFDNVILLHINSVFSVLAQMGLGPTGGFRIEDDTTTWDAFIGVDDELNDVKTYVSHRVTLMWDPPKTSFVIDSMNEIINELAWRLSVKREGTSWVPGTTTE